MTDYPYKTMIEDAVTAHQDSFRRPGRGCREYPLLNRCRADFCFDIMPEGRLFIEDDDGARGVNNLIKYWMWCEDEPDIRPVHVIHILETSLPAQIKAIDFLSARMEQALVGFRYHKISIKRWQDPPEEWLDELRLTVASIAEGTP
jgi:hypothetical protein